MRSATMRSATLLSPSVSSAGQPWGLPQRSPDFAADLFECGTSIRNHRPQAVEKMNHTRVASVGHVNVRAGQALGIIQGLVAQRIEFRRVNQGAWQTGDAAGA